MLQNLGPLAPVANDPRYALLKADICDSARMRRHSAESFQPDGVIHTGRQNPCQIVRSRGRPLSSNPTSPEPTCCSKQRAAVLRRTVGRTAQQVSVSSRQHRRSFRLARRNRIPFHRDHAVLAEPQPVFRVESVAAHHLCRAWHGTYKLPIVISNCSNNYGPLSFSRKTDSADDPQRRSRGSRLPVYGDGSNVRDWLYVEDHVRALFLILRRGRIGAKYNVGGRNEQTNLGVVEPSCDIIDRFNAAGTSHRRLVSFVTDRPGHDQRYAIDASRLRTELGWSAKETFDTGIEKTVRWYLDNREWWESLRRGVYAGGATWPRRSPGAPARSRQTGF